MLSRCGCESCINIHNGGLSDGTSYSRSVIAEPMEYNADGSIKNIPPTKKGAEF